MIEDIRAQTWLFRPEQARALLGTLSPARTNTFAFKPHPQRRTGGRLQVQAASSSTAPDWGKDLSRCCNCRWLKWEVPFFLGGGSGKGK
jgi:hypothetical protein